MARDMESYIAEVSTSFKRGTAEMLLLTLLTERDYYAYDLSKALKESSNGQFDIQGPSLYTVLYRMQERGFVSTWSEKVGRRTRIYYHILPEGKDYLERILQEYLHVSGGIMAVLTKSGKLSANGKQENN